MELLVALIGEFVVAIAFPLVALVFDAVFGVVAFIAHAVFGLTLTKPSSAGPPTRPVASKVLLIGAGLCGGLFLAGLVVVVVANFFFFSPTVTWVAERVSGRSGIEIAFSHAQGNLFTGRLSIRGLQVERRNTDKNEYAITTDRVELDVDVLSLILGDPTFSQVSLEGVGGDIWTKARNADSVSADGLPQGQLKPRKEFEIRSLHITNAEIELHKAGAPPVALTIDKLASTPFRSRYAIFDVFFRANIAGNINGHKILIATSGEDDGRTTTWRLNDFPAEFVGHYVDRAPFSWFESGTVDVMVDDSWSRGPAPEIDMDWRIVLKGVRVAKPDNSSFIGRAVSRPIAHYINSRDKDVDLHFRMVMNEEQFKSKPSLDAAGLWLAVLNGTAKAIAEKSELNVDQVKEGIGNSIDSFKHFLDRKRKGEPAETPKP